MTDHISSKQDLKQLRDRQISPAKVAAQLEAFKRGISYICLDRPCTVGDGIRILQESEHDRLSEIYSQAVLTGRAMKFVPASGAATRMFKDFVALRKDNGHIDEYAASKKAREEKSEYSSLSQFIKGLNKFAFYHDLESVMAKDGHDIGGLVSNGRYKDILDYLLTSKGLGFEHLPKGLIPFHRYKGYSRTPFEEHLVECASYCQDGQGIARMHFTVSAEYEGLIKNFINEIRGRYEKSGTRFEIGFSIQRPSTDTIAVDSQNKPFRDKEGRLLFRPGGHGALLENLNDLKADIIFIRNIDNVVPDRLKREISRHAKVFGGFLIELQNEVFSCLKKLLSNDVTEPFIKQTFEFITTNLSIVLPEGIEKASRQEKLGFLIKKLKRPIRVCGMVKNFGETGGGPFWVDNGDKGSSIQIVETPQVDMESDNQRDIWASSTHFNTVDLVCGVRDYLGRPYNLMNYSDPDTGFITFKSKDGRKLKALELPGLWNGAMADWNTVFVEMPHILFNPVKTVNDLLGEAHATEKP